MTARRTFGLLAGVCLLLLVLPAAGQDVQMDPDTVNFRLSMEGEQFTAAVKIFLLLTMLSVAPAMVLMMTSFTRIVIVFSFLKQAMGSRQAPSNKTVSALALFLTIFIMQPVWTEIYDQAVVPYADEELTEDEAIERGIKPLKGFMLRQTRESTLLLFMELSDMEPVESVEKLPMRVVVPAFMLSELKTAFQMAFLIYLPFLLIDAVVATTLMSMGMFMLPPMMVSMPFKLLLFVMFNGWELLVRTLVTSFY